MRQIVLDTETTGLDPLLGHRIIELGAVEIVNRRITEELQKLASDRRERRLVAQEGVIEAMHAGGIDGHRPAGIDVAVELAAGRDMIEELDAADFDHTVAAARIEAGGFGIEDDFPHVDRPSYMIGGAERQGQVMAIHTTDQSILGAIDKLAKEEHALYEKGDLSDEEKARLKKINVELDQAWDLLRQRRAKREFGQNPDEADIRPPRIVENYEN